MNFITFLLESSKDIAAAIAHEQRCAREYDAAVKRGDEDEIASWDEEWDTAREQLAQLKSAAKKSVKESGDNKYTVK